MSAPVKQRYVDDEGLEVFIEDLGIEGSARRVLIRRDGKQLAGCTASTYEQAQIIARLLVGIEIQPDGAAWRRGPRSPAMPTDASGRIIHEEGGQ